MDTKVQKVAEVEFYDICEHLHLITDSVPVNLSYIDREIRFRFVNRGFEKRYAMPRERIIGMHVREVVGIEFFDLVRHHIDAGLAGTEVNFTVEVPASSAPPGHLQITYLPHFNDKGQVIGIFTQSVDITERVKTEEALRASEERYRTVFENTGTATVIIEEDMTLSLVNEDFVRLSGYRREEIEGKMCWTDFVADTSREMMMSYHKARRTDDVTAPSIYEFDFVDRFGTVRNILTNVKMIHGTSRSVMSYQDITAQKQAQRLHDGEKRIMELIASEATLGEVLELICLTAEGQIAGGFCSILLVDPDGTNLRHGAPPSLPDDFNQTIYGTTHGLQVCCSTPVIASTGELLGTLALYFSSIRQPSETELQLIERATNLTSIAIERVKGRELLKANFHFLKVLIDTIPNPVFYKNASGAYLGCNKAFLNIHGLREKEIIGKKVFDLAPPDLARQYALMDQTLLAAPGIQVYESKVLFADGNMHEVIFSKATFGHRDGISEGLVGVMVDITGVKQAEQNILTLQRQQQALLDNIPDFVWLKDVESRYIAVNEAFAKACGSTPAQLVGKGDLDIWRRDLAELYLNDDHLVMALIQKRRIEEPMEDSKGEHYWVETIKMPVIDENGVVVGTTGIARNIEGRKRAEEALRESEERFRGIFEQNADAIVLLRRKSIDVIDANPAAEHLFGYTRNELMHLGLFAAISPEEYDAFILVIPQSGETSVFHLDRLKYIKRNGEAIIVSIWGKIINLRCEEVIYCSIRDITAQIQMEEEVRITQARLIHANKMTSLGVLVSGIAHEINNPNTFIQGNASILEKIWRDVMPILAQYSETSPNMTLGRLPFEEIGQIVPRLLVGLKEGSRRISAIVGNLKDFAREDKSVGHIAIDINNIIRDGALILSPFIHTHTDNFLLKLDDGLPLVMGKAQQVEQVIINLIMNGLQSLPNKRAGLTVSTRADHATDTVVITVKDEGEGMTAEVLMRLTEPFFSTRLDRGGTGLGLSICAAIIKEHNGSLQFESTPEAGTTAMVTLAIAP